MRVLLASVLLAATSAYANPKPTPAGAEAAVRKWLATLDAHAIDQAVALATVPYTDGYGCVEEFATPRRPTRPTATTLVDLRAQIACWAANFPDAKDPHAWTGKSLTVRPLDGDELKALAGPRVGGIVGIARDHHFAALVADHELMFARAKRSDDPDADLLYVIAVKTVDSQPRIAGMVSASVEGMMTE